MNPHSLWSKLWVRMAVYAAGGYLGLILMLLYIENWLIYRPTTAAQHWVEPPPGSGIEDVTLTTQDGTRIHAWWLPAENSDQALLYCHGNAGNLSHRGGSIVKVGESLNVSVLIIDYPGYGKSEGRPSEKGCCDAADAAHTWLTDEKKFAPKKILLYGASLGGGVVTELASRKDCRALILVKTFTSLPEAAGDIYWWLPVPKSALMRNRFDNLTRIKSCQRPVFLAHGTDDRLIPHSHSERLFQAANEPKRFISLPGGDHNHALPNEMFTELNEFLAKNP